MADKPKYSEVMRDAPLQDYGAVKTDSKNRVVLKGPVHELYRIYRNDAGQIILDPQVMIPAREAWLFKNPSALKSVRRGLKEVKEGKLRGAGSFKKHAENPLDD